MIIVTVKEFLRQEKKSPLPCCLKTDFTLTFPAFVLLHAVFKKLLFFNMGWSEIF